MLKIGDIIKVHIMDPVHHTEIRTRNHEKTFEIVPDVFGSPGIWWEGEENGLYLLVSFSWSVIFENAKTGERFHPDTISGEIVPC